MIHHRQAEKDVCAKVTFLTTDVTYSVIKEDMHFVYHEMNLHNIFHF